MLNPPRKPRVFIVSSTETHLVSEVIKNCVKRHAEVVPWYLDSVWKHGDFILQVLLEQAPKYDFAVIIFAQDDKTISRGNEAYAPRDNVIFEAGLFMAHLGHKRTFIVTPKEQNLKILSDLAGLVLLSYDEPTPTSGLQGALKSVCDKICTEINNKKSVAPRSLLALARAVLEKLTPRSINCLLSSGNPENKFQYLILRWIWNLPGA